MKKHEMAEQLLVENREQFVPLLVDQLLYAEQLTSRRQGSVAPHVELGSHE